MKITFWNYLLFISLLISVFSCDDEETKPSEPDNTSVSEIIVPNDLLSGDRYDSLLVEIQYAEGYAPPAEAINYLTGFMEKHLNKPQGISVKMKSIPAPGKSIYSPDDIREIEKKNRQYFPNGKTMTVYFFFADGGYTADSDQSKVLGIAYGSTSMAIFQKTINDFSGGLAQPSGKILTATVLNHEFGHILGLVNNGTTMQINHQDTDHGRHCNNQECLMYWATETSQGLEDLLGLSSPPDLDNSCVADLQANGGK